MSLSDIEALLPASGLLLRGAFHPEPADRVPALDDGRPAGTLVLLGAIGGSFWPRFSRSPEYGDGNADSLDRWSARVVGALACRLGAGALFPFGGPPYHPFVAWAKRAEPVAESALGMLIHPQHGLWHAYRGALAFAERLALPPRQEAPRPCDSCVDKPCLSTCPVGAFSAQGYDVAACAAHILGPEGAICLEGGCLARLACPVGREHHYGEDQAAFHMAAFADARRRGRAA
ncbi:MAG: hypothetical protein AAF495_13855 [Pseudomonadota bacterium]